MVRVLAAAGSVMIIMFPGRWSTAETVPGKPVAPTKQTDSKPPYTLVESAASSSPITWRRLERSEVIFHVANAGSKQEVVVKVTGISWATATGSGALEVQPGDAKLDKLAVQRFEIRTSPPGSKPPPGRYTGLLLIRDKAEKFAPLSKAIDIVVPAVELAVPKIAGTATRLVPFTPLWWGPVIAVPVKSAAAFSPKSRFDLGIGFVRKESGGIAPVRWTATTVNRDGTSGFVTLAVDHLPYAGKYEGNMDFGGMGDAGETLGLSIVARDFVFWPALVIALGTLVALLGKRYIGVLRLTWSLRQQEAEVSATFQESQKTFARAAHDQAFGAYSLAKDYAEQRSALVAAIRTLEASWSTTIENTNAYKAALTTLTALRTAAEGWASLGGELGDLAVALNDARRSVDPGSPISRPIEPPAVLTTSAKILGAEKEVTVAELDATRKTVVDAATFVASWTEVNEAAKRVTAAYHRAVSAKPQSQPELSELRMTLISVWRRLWEAKTVDDLPALRGDLQQAAIRLDQAANQSAITSSMGPGAGAHQLIGVSEVVDPFRASSDMGYILGHHPERAAQWQKAIATGDRLWTSIAFVIALLTGLNIYYLGKPFGTTADYVTVFLWAAGTKAALDLITSVVDRLVPRAQPA